MYLQDDFRVVKSLMLSYGLRYEAQTLIADQNNFSPRVTATWSPLKNGRTTFRAGWGWFSDWIGSTTYRQTLQVDGVRQQELNILNPGYPDPGITGVTPPANHYLFGPDMVLPQSMTINAGVDQQLVGGLRLNATYTYRRGSNLLRGRNLNVPVAGVRPDPALANVVEVETDAGSRTHSLNIGANILLLNWHRTLFAANYSLTSSQSNTSGPFSLPAIGDALGLEWAPVAMPRHRFGAQFNTQLMPALGFSITARAQSGTPYNITTGLDNNRDGVFNDRPAGVSRNSALTPGQWDLGARLSYSIGFGQRAQAGGGGQQVMVQIGGPGGGMPSGGISMSDNKRYHVEFYASAQNVTNHSNYIGYSGVMTSPFFGRPTNVMNPRKVEVGTRFAF